MIVAFSEILVMIEMTRPTKGRRSTYEYLSIVEEGHTLDSGFLYTDGIWDQLQELFAF